MTNENKSSKNINIASHKNSHYCSCLVVSLVWIVCVVEGWSHKNVGKGGKGGKGGKPKGGAGNEPTGKCKGYLKFLLFILSLLCERKISGQ